MKCWNCGKDEPRLVEAPTPTPDGFREPWCATCIDAHLDGPPSCLFLLGLALVVFCGIVAALVLA